MLMAAVFSFGISVAFAISRGVAPDLIVATNPWIGPKIAPPNTSYSNLSAPINLGSIMQIKSGGLWTGSMLVDNGMLVSSGKIGIGVMSPVSKVDVNGGMKLSNDGGECDSSKAGTIQWTGSDFQGCDGTAWSSFAPQANCSPDSPLTQTLSCPSGQTGSITQTRTSTCPGPTTSEWTTTSYACSTPCTPASPLTQTLSCPSGQTGSITQTRSSTCPGPTTSEWTTTSYTCSTPCTPASPLTQTLSCPSGQTGSITQTRSSTCPGPTTSGWTTTSNTCTTPCTPASPLTQTLSCPSGQIGSITQTRTSTCPGPTTSGWTTTGNTCHVPASCGSLPSGSSCVIGSCGSYTTGNSTVYKYSRKTCYDGVISQSSCGSVTCSASCFNSQCTSNCPPGAMCN